MAPRAALVVLPLVALLGCGSPPSEDAFAAPTPQKEGASGTATIDGTLDGLSLDSSTARAIARVTSPTVEIMLAPTTLDCRTMGTTDHLTIDLGAEATGTYAVMKGYPKKPSLQGFEARVHACPANLQDVQCREDVLGGRVDVTRFDGAAGGSVVGTYTLQFANGTLSGTFSALRCD